MIEISNNIIHNWHNVKRGAVILDTETTGFDELAEICEISIIDTRGKMLFSSLIKPFNDIPAEATAIHGITNEDVVRAPHWDQVHAEIRQHLHQRKVIAYNCDYDTRLLRQTARIYGLAGPERWDCEWLCAMQSFADFAKQPDTKRGGYRWMSLINAAKHLGLPLPQELHRSLPDCELTLAVLQAAYAQLTTQTPQTAETQGAIA